MKKVLTQFLSLITVLLLSNYSFAQSPTTPALGFNAFLQQNATLVTNESEGPIAIGGDLTVNGNYQVNIHNSGTFAVSSVPIGLFVGGKVNLSSGSLQVNSGRYVKIGNCASSNIKTWYRDNNNAASNIYITGSAASYASTPNININSNAFAWGTEVSASNNPVCDANTASEISFASAFTSMKASAASLAACTGTANLLSNPNQDKYSSNCGDVNTGGQVKITLATGTNVLNISGSDLNSVTNGITFTNQPDANHVLVINVNAAGSFTWNVWNQAGIGGTNAPYIIYNFYNTTSLSIAGNSTIEGTVFAPNADITKTVNQSNIEGQVIGQSFVQSGGELHYYPFTPSVSGCEVTCTPTAATLNVSTCNSYTWHGTTYTTSGVHTFDSLNKGGCDSLTTLNLTIKSASASTTNASFCDGGSYTFNGTSYSAAGSYTAHLTNAAGCDSAATLVLTKKFKSISTTNASICDGGSYTFNGTSYSTAGSYTAHLTNAAGCDSAATLVLTVKSKSTSTTNASICSGNSYTFNGNSYLTAGSYTVHLTNAAGCDSAATLVLTVGSPSNIVVTQTAATCNSLGNPSYNGTLTIASGSYASKFGISSLNAASYNGADYNSATSIGSLPATAKTGVPNTGGTYIVRVYGSDASCYTDTKVTVAEVLCGGKCDNTVFPAGSPIADLNWVVPPYNTTTFNNLYEPGSSSPVGSFTVYAPGNLSLQSQNLSNYPAFCSDLSRDLYINTNYTNYTVEPLEYLAKEDQGVVGTPGMQIPDGGIGPVRAGMVRYLVDQHYVSTNSTDAGWSTNNHATAFQLALWEITHDQYNVSNINFSVKNATANGFYFDYNANSATNQAILDTAELWVKDVQNKNIDWTAYVSTVWHAVALNTPQAQDLVTAEPISACGVTTPVSSGGSGGLESKSLGAAIGTRNFNIYKNSKNGPVKYVDAERIIAPKKGGYQTFGTSASHSLAATMPYKVSASYVPYDKTAEVADLTSITNAVDVRTIDFTLNNSPRAVAFATKTIGGIYSHTKPICDRLKGAQLLNIENISIENISFIRYTIQQPDGSTEYAVSFSAGQKAGRSTFSIQSDWLMPDYASEDTMYNYQLWASTKVDVNTMVTEVLSKLQATMPVAQLSSNNDLPGAYVSAASRQGTNLNLTVNNRTANTTGYFLLTQRATEATSASTTLTVPFTIGTNGKTTVSVPVGDMYDANISMVFNNNTTDMLYMADGIWGTSGDNATTVSQFNVINNSTRKVAANEYALMRDVQVQVTTPSYLSIYKYLKGGAAAVDLSAYKSFHFTASTNTEGMNLTVTITKQSVGNWNSQYTYTINNLQDGQTYDIALSSFKSADGTLPATIDASDITSVVYNVVNTTGQSLSIKAGISNAAFSTVDIAYQQALEVKTVSVSPNPNNGNFKVSFTSASATQLRLAIVDITGRIVSNTLVNAVTGKNEVAVNLGQSTKGNIYFVSLQGSGAKYNTQKILIK